MGLGSYQIFHHPEPSSYPYIKARIKGSTHGSYWDTIRNSEWEKSLQTQCYKGSPHFCYGCGPASARGYTFTPLTRPSCMENFTFWGIFSSTTAGTQEAPLLYSYRITELYGRLSILECQLSKKGGKEGCISLCNLVR